MPDRHDPVRDTNQNTNPEPGQVDPLLREGRVGRWGAAALVVVVAVILGFVFYHLTTPGPNAPAGGGQNAATSAPRPAATNGTGSGQTGH